MNVEHQESGASRVGTDGVIVQLDAKCALDPGVVRTVALVCLG